MAEVIYDKNLINANLNMMNKKIEMEKDLYLQDNELTEEEQRILDAAADEAFMTNVMKAATREEMQALFVNRGINWSLCDIDEFMHSVKTASTKIVKTPDELTDDELEEITGGMSLFGKIAAWVCAAIIGVAVGVMIGVATVATGGLALAIGGGIVTGLAVGGGLGICWAD